VSPAIASDAEEVREFAGLIRDDETVLLMIRPSAWFIFSTSMGALPAAAVAGGLLMLASLDPSIPWDFRGAILASVAILIARAAWQMIDWIFRLYILTDRRIVVRHGAIPEIHECLLGEVAGIGQPYRWSERMVNTGSLAILSGPSRRIRRARRVKQTQQFEESPLSVKKAEGIREHPRVHVDRNLEWSVIRDSENVRRTILNAVSRYR
jgi:hypothetical protein